MPPAVLLRFGDRSVPAALSDWLVAQQMPQWLFLLLVNGVLIIAGIFAAAMATFECQ